MRILLLTQVVPYPPDSGPKIKTYHVLRWLAQQHDVTLVSFARSPAEFAAAEALRPLCRAVHTVPLVRSRKLDIAAALRMLHDPRPLTLLRDDSDSMHNLLQRLLATHSYDLIHADQLNMTQFALAANGIPTVLDLHNAVWTIVDRMARSTRGPKRWLLTIERNRLRRYEAWACQQAAAVLAVSEADRAALQTVAGPVPIDVVPIAIDVDEQPVIMRDPQPTAALSVATMFWPPNVDGVCWFGRDIYPHVTAQHPDTPFYVVGARPAHAVQALATQHPGIIVTGYVPDLLPFQRQTAAFVVPLRAGSGMRVKILEALTRGLPIVTTTIGTEGIPIRHGKEALIADEPRSFADAVVQLIREPARGRRLAEAGRAFAAQHYDWRRVCPAIDATYLRATA